MQFRKKGDKEKRSKYLVTGDSNKKFPCFRSDYLKPDCNRDKVCKFDKKANGTEVNS